MSAAQPIHACRICGNTTLPKVLDLGNQVLTGLFPRSKDAVLTAGPLQLLKCHGKDGCCELVQLAHDYDLVEMYGENYGYRSGLNRSMVRHLASKVEWLQKRRPLNPGDVVLDIGSNDGTTLGLYPDNLTLLGIDPTIKKFGHHYAKHIQKVPDFFTAKSFKAAMGEKKARIITSISMFYDLPAPLEFVKEVAAVLADDGIWHLEQSYLPLMVETHGYDTVCHEHLEYYGVTQLKWMTSRAGLRITDIELNDINGGSFAVTIEKGTGPDAPIVAELIAKEQSLQSLELWSRFAADVARHRTELLSTLTKLKADGKKVFGLGASTKGNVLLQYCGITADLLPCIAEVNPDKFGCFTPGTKIPIVSEEQARAEKPDVFFVLPWHFRAGFLEREKPFFASGGKLMFPLPEISLYPS